MGCERFAKRDSDGGGCPRAKARIISGVVSGRPTALWRFRNGLGGQRRPQRRREDFSDQQALCREAETGAPRPERRPVADAEGFGSTSVQWVAPVDRLAAQWRARETGVPEEHAAERAASQSGEPACQRSARADGQYRVGEDERLVIDEKHDFADPGALGPAKPEQRRFVGGRRGEFLRYDAQRKAAATLQARRQRAVVKQPVPERVRPARAGPMTAP